MKYTDADIAVLETKLVKIEGRGSKRVYKILCDACDGVAWKRGVDLRLYKTHFCSPACSYAHRRKRVKGFCANCGDPVARKPGEFKKSLSGNMFCSQGCNTSYLNKRRLGELHPLYVDGSSTYRKVALEIHGAYCHADDCDLRVAEIEVGENMLDVHHRDGDRKNSNPENLFVLCVWCHAKLTRGR